MPTGNGLAGANAGLRARRTFVGSINHPYVTDLRHHTILITGGASGLYEFARQLLALGNTVLITGRDQAKPDAAKRQLPQVHTFRSDVSDPAAI